MFRIRPLLLPAARYRLATKIRGRGVFSFCMCPGGWIVPAATENDEVVVNGMSLSRRDSPFANSGMVSTVEPEDVKPLVKEHGVLAGLAFQKSLERAAKKAGGGGQVARRDPGGGGQLLSGHGERAIQSLHAERDGGARPPDRR